MQTFSRSWTAAQKRFSGDCGRLSDAVQQRFSGDCSRLSDEAQKRFSGTAAGSLTRCSSGSQGLQQAV
ncbi:MAG: hypothetical protein IJ860_03215 [Eubacterium sp.]|nr:hypothetical protein [Eubacterium sp.]